MVHLSPPSASQKCLLSPRLTWDKMKCPDHLALIPTLLDLSKAFLTYSGVFLSHYTYHCQNSLWLLLMFSPFAIISHKLMTGLHSMHMKFLVALCYQTIVFSFSLLLYMKRKFYFTYLLHSPSNFLKLLKIIYNMRYKYKQMILKQAQGTCLRRENNDKEYDPLGAVTFDSHIPWSNSKYSLKYLPVILLIYSYI